MEETEDDRSNRKWASEMGIKKRDLMKLPWYLSIYCGDRFRLVPGHNKSPSLDND